ncbi:hypothetical protein SAMN02745133_00939 [Desulforamulus putei DSM 12395]|uniref:Universal stress protein family protein n=1 Tax=Desulforamulus putei DSM 12395 TaxID=1121429 RepID=A0A1M4VI86_9FIRM|nr:hypothetical protein [Desulforamulus putei]SHE68567.1 hypothetical protein SAMN02745133_00939 [Desulforamulus putei DSM 12395]
MKILLAVDNSENALRAGQYVVKLASALWPTNSVCQYSPMVIGCFS